MPANNTEWRFGSCCHLVLLHFWFHRGTAGNPAGYNAGCLDSLTNLVCQSEWLSTWQDRLLRSYRPSQRGEKDHRSGKTERLKKRRETKIPLLAPTVLCF